MTELLKLIAENPQYFGTCSAIIIGTSIAEVLKICIREVYEAIKPPK